MNNAKRADNPDELQRALDHEGPMFFYAVPNELPSIVLLCMRNPEIRDIEGHACTVIAFPMTKLPNLIQNLAEVLQDSIDQGTIFGGKVDE